MIPPRVFVTGTDTDVGKTVVSALLCRALGRPYWKPVQSGLPADRDTVASLGVATFPEAYRLALPASPHLAAREDGVEIDVARIVAPDVPELVVEGAGGWMVPYRLPDLWTDDLVRVLDLPVVVVARTGLGTLNHTLLTLRAMRADGAELVGLVLVGDPHPENEAVLAAHGARVLGRVPRIALPGGFDAAAKALAEQLSRSG